jgi:hypothetical protein
MNTHAAAFVFFTGLIMTMFGVGGVEHSIETADLVTSTIVAAVGLLVMYAGTLGLRTSEYYDHN